MSRSVLYRCSTVASLLCAATITFTSLALAGTATPRGERVYLGDLDLSRAQDQQRMQHRVDAAIERVCAREAPALQPVGRVRRALQECREQARRDVQRQLERHTVLAQARG